MTSPTSGLRARLRLCVALGVGRRPSRQRAADRGRARIGQGRRAGRPRRQQGGGSGRRRAGRRDRRRGRRGRRRGRAVTGGNNSNSGNNAKPANDKGGQPAASDKQGAKTAKTAKGTKEAKARKDAQAGPGADTDRCAATDGRTDRLQQRRQYRADQDGAQSHARAGEELVQFLQRHALSRAQRRRPPQSAHRARQARSAGRHHRADAQRGPVPQSTARRISAMSPMPPSRSLRASTTSRSRYSSTKWCA